MAGAMVAVMEMEEVEVKEEETPAVAKAVTAKTVMATPVTAMPMVTTAMATPMVPATVTMATVMPIQEEIRGQAIPVAVRAEKAMTTPMAAKATVAAKAMAAQAVAVVARAATMEKVKAIRAVVRTEIPVVAVREALGKETPMGTPAGLPRTETAQVGATMPALIAVMSPHKIPQHQETPGLDRTHKRPLGCRAF